MSPTIEFEEEMAAVESSCEIDHEGSLRNKYINILVQLVNKHS